MGAVRSGWFRRLVALGGPAGTPSSINLANATGYAGSRASFLAHKNAVDQSGIAVNVMTKVALQTEVYDVGGYYDAPNSRWTPPAGKLSLTGAIYFSTCTIGDLSLLTIFKNGARYRDGGGYYIGATNLGYASIAMQDDANGTDFYELYCFVAGAAGTRVANGAISATWFAGALLS